jgi:hypothetical protein
LQEEIVADAINAIANNKIVFFILLFLIGLDCKDKIPNWDKKIFYNIALTFAKYASMSFANLIALAFVFA